eukprot:scaffold58118_cov37-Cyclotella_meneghiniana.AAC.10
MSSDPIDDNNSAPLINADATAKESPINQDVEMLDDAPPNNEPECFIHIRGLVGPPITSDQKKQLRDWINQIYIKALNLNYGMSIDGDVMETCVGPGETLLAVLTAGEEGDDDDDDDDHHPLSNKNGLNNWERVIRPVIESCLASTMAESNNSTSNNSTAAVNNNGRSSNSSNNNIMTITMKSPLQFTLTSQSPFNTHQRNTAASLYLYYTSLERILLSHTSSTSRNMLLLNVQFHKSLYSLCQFSIEKASRIEVTSFDIGGTGSCPIVYYKLIESFISEMRGGGTGTIKLVLPEYIIRVLRLIQEMILDSLWLMDYHLFENDGYYTDNISSSNNGNIGNNDNNGSLGPSFIAMINKLRERPSSWPPASLRELCPIKSGRVALSHLNNNETSCKESMFVGYIIQKLLILIDRRLHALCRELSLPHSNNLSLSTAQDVKERTMTLYTCLMCYRIDVFFNAHPDQIMLCCLYMICRKAGMARQITFCEIVRVYEREKRRCLSEELVMSILYRIENCSVDSDGGGVGDILAFYNNIFVPSIKGLWSAFLESTDMSGTKESFNNTA